MPYGVNNPKVLFWGALAQTEETQKRRLAK